MGSKKTLAELINEDPENISDIESRIQKKHAREVSKNRIRKIIAGEKDRAKAIQKIDIEKKQEARYVDIHDIDNLSGLQFEKALALMLSERDGDAEVTQGSGDQGVDVLWHRNEGTVAIQAKSYQPGNKVTNSAVQEVKTGSEKYTEQHEIIEKAVISTSSYTSSAKEAADFSSVKLYDRKKLREWLKKEKIGLEKFGQTIERNPNQRN
ncbi:MAG: restriction endonuclease [Candidatus Nanohalobium sp.]